MYLEGIMQVISILLDSASNIIALAISFRNCDVYKMWLRSDRLDSRAKRE